MPPGHFILILSGVGAVLQQGTQSDLSACARGSLFYNRAIEGPLWLRLPQPGRI